MRIAFVFALLIALVLLLYRTFRPYIKLVRQFVQSVRHFQKVVTSTPTSPRREGEKLVQCENCGTWIPESRALKSNLNEFCSSDCLKRAGVSQRRKTAG